MARLRLAALAALALLVGRLVPALDPGPGLALGAAAVALTGLLLLRGLGRALPGELHLLRARLGLPAHGAPPTYVRRLFDSYAARYDDHLMAGLDYRVPNLLRDLVGERLAGSPRPPAVADLGCGTGVLGPLFRGLAGTLDGVDLSGAMLARARARGLYDGLVEGELVAFLEARPGRYDLLLAADVLPYLGEPAPFLRAAARALRPGGRLAFSVERGGRAGRPLVLTRSGRFAHDPEALEEAAATFGLAPEAHLDASLRREAGAPVPGRVMLLKKYAP